MSDNLIVKTHYKRLRAIYYTQTRIYEELLHLSEKKKIDNQNLQILMVEVYKSLNNISLLFKWDYFKQKNTPSHLRDTQKWQKCLDASDRIVGTLLIDLSKAYDCVKHDLIIPKLEAFGVVENSLRLTQNYLSQTQQREKVGSSFNEWLEIILGIP